jgi:hypothetical protein
LPNPAHFNRALAVYINHPAKPITATATTRITLNILLLFLSGLTIALLSLQQSAKDADARRQTEAQRVRMLAAKEKGTPAKLWAVS